MAKIYGLGGSLSGKAGNYVFSSANGVSYVRQYNGSVSNPQTSAQIAQRAKFKLINQVAAAVAPFIAIKKSLGVTGRNMFVSRNMENVFFMEGEAYVALQDLQLTNSSIALCGFKATRSEGRIEFELLQDMHANVDAVAYLVMSLGGSQELTPYDSVIVSNPGDNGKFAADCADPTGVIVVYAYGVRYNSKGAYNKFDKLTISTADALARLATSTDLSNAIGAFTETRGFDMGENETSGETSGINAVIITANAYDRQNAEGFTAAITGAGSKQVGSTVTVVAPEIDNYTWVGWMNSDRTTTLSAERTYSFTAASNLSIWAVYDGPNQNAGSNEE